MRNKYIFKAKLKRDESIKDYTPRVIEKIAESLDKEVIDFDKLAEIKPEEYNKFILKDIRVKRYFPDRFYLYNPTEDEPFLSAKVSGKVSGSLVIFLETEEMMKTWEEKGIEGKIREQLKISDDDNNPYKEPIVMA